MTKPITAVAMMMPFEEGKWQLDDPVAKFVPEFANLKVYGWFWIDPVEDLIVIGMTQQVAGTGAAAVVGVPDLRGLSHAFLYQAVLEPGS